MIKRNFTNNTNQDMRSKYLFILENIKTFKCKIKGFVYLSNKSNQNKILARNCYLIKLKN